MTRGPDSFLEWVVGRNLPNHSRRPRGPRRVARIDWSADEDSGEDTVALTVPRRPPRPKKVRFEEAEPLKSALKKLPAAAAAAEESLGESSDATTNTDTTGDGSDTEEASDSDCPCSKCDTERKKQAKIDEATHAKHKQEKARKARATAYDKSKKPAEDDSDTAVESDSDGPKEHKAKRKKKKNKRKKAKDNVPKAHAVSHAKQSTRDDTDTSDETESSDTAEKLKKKEKRKEKRENRRAKDKKAKLLSRHPPAGIRQPDLLMPASSSVLQIEHAVEGAGDPKPNAFYDPVNGVMRMYHGPAYANPYGRLYPQYPQRTDNHQPLPVRVPHPTNNPWYYGFTNEQGQHPAAAPQMVQAPQGPPVTPAPPAPAPAPQGAHPWFQGHGTAVVGGGDADASPSASAAERKKKKATGMNPGTPWSSLPPPNKPRSDEGIASAGSKSRKDTQTLWQDIRHKPSNDADGRGKDNWGAHDSKGVNDFLDRLSAKYSNSPKSNKSKSPGKEGGSRKAGSSGWPGVGDQNGFGNWNNDNNDNKNISNSNNGTNDQWGNNIGNQNSNWDNGNNNAGNQNSNWHSGNNNNDASNQWGNANGNQTSNYNWGGHTNANAGDWGTPDNFGMGNASNAGNGGFPSKQSDNGNNNNNNNNWGGGSNKGQIGTAWETTAMDQANNLAGGGWGGSIKNGWENGSDGGAKSNTHRPTVHVKPPGSWPNDDKQAQASPRASSSGARLPSTGGNVVGAFDDWGDASKNNGGGAGWQDSQAAQSTSYWDNEGKGTEKDTTGPVTGGKESWW